jgi:hypothetical protein
MNRSVTEMLRNVLLELVINNKVCLREGEMIMEDNKIAFNIGEGTELYNDLHDVMARCLIKITKELSVVKSKLCNLEKAIGTYEVEKSDKNNIKN